MYNQLKLVKEGKVFFVTVESKEIEELRKASEKYEIKIPDAKYMVTYCDGMFDIYYQLEDYGIVEWAFGGPESNVNQIKGLPMDYRDEENAKSNALTLLMGNLDNMYWGDILSQYLAEEGIEYEEAQQR